MAKSMRISLDYLPVPGIIDDLLAQGLHPSVERVRERLGRGSNQTISAMIKDRLRALGRVPQEDVEARAALPVASCPLPAPNPAAVATMLHLLRAATQMARAEAQAQRFTGGGNHGHTGHHPDPDRR